MSGFRTLEQNQKMSRFECAMLRLLIIITLLWTPLAKAQDIEGIMQDHYKAYKQDFWDQVQTVNIRGIWLIGQDKASFELLAKKPGKVMLRGRWQVEPYAESFDGSSGWTIAPWTGVKTPQLMLPKEQLMLRSVFEFGSPIPRDVALEYRGEGDAYGVPCYRLAASIDGVEYEYFVDEEDFFVRRMDRRELIGNHTQILTKRYDQYRKFGGVVIPTLVIVRVDDLEKEYVFDDIIVGDGISNLTFRRPE